MAVIERTISTRELNRTLLARQLLLERSDLPLTDVLERIGGLQTQYAPSGYVGLWSRLRDFPRESLTEALEARRVIQATLMRSTIHMVSARDYWPFAQGTRAERREWWLRSQRQQLEGIDLDAAIVHIRRLLANSPRRQAEMLERLAAEGLPRLGWVGPAHWIDLVRVPPSGTWKERRADLYGLADDWLGSSTSTEAEGQAHLVRRYLEGFGPAPLVDIASWAGIRATRLRAVIERLELRRFRDERGSELLDLPDQPLPDPDIAAPVRFLPTWDATLLVHARRTAILPERYRPLVFNTKTPHSVPTFLVDGAVAGTWRYEKGRVAVEPFEPLAAATLKELDDEAARLAAFHTE